VTLGDLQRAGVGTFADVPGSGARGVDDDVVRGARFGHQMKEDPLGQR